MPVWVCIGFPTHQRLRTADERGGEARVPDGTAAHHGGGPVHTTDRQDRQARVGNVRQIRPARYEVTKYLINMFNP